MMCVLTTYLPRKHLEERDLISQPNLGLLWLNVREPTPPYKSKPYFSAAPETILRSDEVTVPPHCCEWGHTERCSEAPHLSGECCSSAKPKFTPEGLWAMSSYLSTVKEMRKSQAGNYFQRNNLFNKFIYFPFMNCALWVQENTSFFNLLQ